MSLAALVAVVSLGVEPPRELRAVRLGAADGVARAGRATAGGAARAGRAIATKGGQAASELGRRALATLDKDGDGEVSLEELEGAAARACRWCGGVARRLGRIWRRNRPVGLVLTGLIGLVHGGSFSHTVLFAQTFKATGWPLVRSGLERARAAYDSAKSVPMSETRARQQSRAELHEKLRKLGEEAEALRREGKGARARLDAVVREMRRVRAELDALPSSRRAGPVLAAMALREPMVFRDLALGLWSGASVAVAAACNSAARSVGIGASVGEAVAGALDVLVRRVDLWCRQLASSLPAGATAAAYFGPGEHVRAAIWCAGRGVGLALAVRLQGAAMQLSVCLLSASALLRGLTELRQASMLGARGPSDDAEAEAEAAVAVAAASPPPAPTAAARWLVAAAGLHLQRSNAAALPLLLKVALLPAFAAEAALRGIAAKLTKDDMKLARQPAPVRGARAR